MHGDFGLFRGFFPKHNKKLWELRDLYNFFFPQEFLLALISRAGFLLDSCEDLQSLTCLNQLVTVGLGV